MITTVQRTTLRAILATRCHDGVNTGDGSVVDAWADEVRQLKDGRLKLVIPVGYTKNGADVTVYFGAELA